MYTVKVSVIQKMKSFIFMLLLFSIIFTINYAQMVESDLYETSQRPHDCKYNKRKKLIPFLALGTVLKMFQT